jgi:hypothetical protein
MGECFTIPTPLFGSLNDEAQCSNVWSVNINFADIFLTHSLVDVGENEGLHGVNVEDQLDELVVWVREDLIRQRLVRVNIVGELEDSTPKINVILDNNIMESFLRQIEGLEVVHLSLDESIHDFVGCWEEADIRVKHIKY